MKVECQCCRTPKVELYKLKDEIWLSAEFALRDILCIKCFEERLGRGLSVDDLDLNFPWWNADRPDYYDGIRDGIAGHSEGPMYENPPEFELGFELGGRIAKNYM